MHEPTVTQSSMPTPNSSALPCALPYDEDRLPLVLLYSLVMVVGLPANMATVYLTWLQVRRKNVLGIYLWSLSVCDLMYLFTLPMWTIYVDGGHKWPWDALTCKVTGYIFFTNMYVSIFLLCCVSTDRYVAVVYAVESRGLRRQRLAMAVTAGTVAVVALGHVPVFTMSEGNADVGARRCFEPGQSTATVTAFNYARFAAGFLAPLAVLVATNRAILRNVRASTGLRPCQKVRVYRLAVAVVVLFLVCFTPYHVILLLRAVTFHFPQREGGGCPFERRIYTAYTISLGLSTFNSAVNPLLYVLSSHNIRKDARRGLRFLRSQSTLRPRSSNSSEHKMQNYSELAGAGGALEKAVQSC
ncbi:putative G-protein coupled receptor 132b [Aplochiton taeniatus]